MLKSFLGFLWATAMLIFSLLWSALIHLVITSVICFVFSFALKYAFDIKISWEALTIFWYGSYLFINHYIQNLLSK